MNAARRYITGTNYCGPGGSGRALGSLDEACRSHDADYKASYYMDYFRSQRADKVFLRRVEGSSPRDFRQRLTRDIARGYFGYKTTLWNSFDKMVGQRQVGDGVVVSVDGQNRLIGRQRKRKSSLPPNQVRKYAYVANPNFIAPPPAGYRAYSKNAKYFRRVPYKGQLFKSKRFVAKKRIFSRFRRRYKS